MKCKNDFHFVLTGLSCNQNLKTDSPFLFQFILCGYFDKKCGGEIRPDFKMLVREKINQSSPNLP